MSSEPLYKEIASEADRLRRLYREEEWTLDEIADDYGVSETTISEAFDEAGLEKRGLGGGPRELSQTERLATDHADELRRLYVDELKSIPAIGDEFGCSKYTIYRAFDEAGIELMPLEQRIAEGVDLERLYVDEHLSTYKIGDRIGCSAQVVSDALKTAGIERLREGYQIENPTVETPIDAGNAAYLAGLIDGEGHLKLEEDSRHADRKEPKCWVKMGNEDLIRHLGDVFGGTVTPEPRDGKTDMWKWRANRALDIRIVLTATVPYLKHKSALAKELVAHIDDHYSELLADSSISPDDVLKNRAGAAIARQYIAGIIDGEGNVGVYSTGGEFYCPRVKVKMGSKPICEWMQSKFGGGCYHRPREPDNHTDMWTWMIQSQDDVRSFLDVVGPHLNVKDDEASDILRFIETGEVPERFQ